MNKLEKFLHKIWDWIIYSSANSEKFSLTLKGLIPFLVLLKIGDVNTLGSMADQIVNAVIFIAQIGTGAITLFGIIRKIVFSIKYL